MRLITSSVLMVCLATVASSCAWSARAPSPPAPVFADVVGTWGWIQGTFTCATNPHTISFSSDWTHMNFAYPQPVDSATGRHDARYVIRGHGPNHIRAFLLDEDRRDAQGNLVEWDLILLSPDLYVWRRSDWPLDASTKPIERCSARAAAPDQQPPGRTRPPG